MRLTDLRETVALAHAAGAVVIVDNTVATPLNQRPFDFGADWIVHSTSKYLNGHSDMIGGCVIRREPLLPRHRAVHKNLGGTVNAFEAWLVLRGLRTFALRMEAHNRNGLAVVTALRHSTVSLAAPAARASLVSRIARFWRGLFAPHARPTTAAL